MKEPLKVASRMLRSFCLLISMAFFSSTSCQSYKASANQDLNDVSMELMVKENYSGFDQERLFLIKDLPALQSFYGIVNRTRKPGLIPPDVDFNEQMLLVWCGGPSASDEMELTISSTEDQLLVQKSSTGKEKDGTPAIVRPFRIYKLPISSKTVRFK